VTRDTDLPAAIRVEVELEPISELLPEPQESVVQGLSTKHSRFTIGALA
jgi:hypothetical protein